MWFDILIIFGLVLINAFFAMSELAIVSASPARLRPLADRGNAAARAALRLRDDPTLFLSTVQVGITLVGVVAGAYSGATLGAALATWLATFPAMAPYASTAGVVIAVVAITYLSLVIGELVPKRLALTRPEAIAMAIALPMTWLAAATRPLAWLLSGSTSLVLRLLRIDTPPSAAMTLDEVRGIIAEATVTGTLDRHEERLVDGALRLRDRSVRSVMTPRRDVTWIDLDGPTEKIAERLRTGGVTRYPAGQGTIDEIVGVLEVRDLMRGGLVLDQDRLLPILRAPLIVPDGTPLARLLELYRDAPTHIAIIVDEYGGVEGVVTPSDVLQALAGDLSEGMADSADACIRRADGSWLVDGMMALDDVERLTDLRNLADGGGYERLAGFVLAKLGRIPKAGDHFTAHDIRFEVVDMDGRRIDKVLITPGPDR